MSERTPFFSVVMPTRNRAKLLPFAVSSLLNQTFGDFEIIISDNCSSDETPQVARQFGDERIKYFRSEKPLSINDSFEFALSHATGEYISFLPDDDAFTTGALARLKQVIDGHQAQVITFHPCFYSHDTNFVPGFEVPANSLAIRNFTGKVTEFTAAGGIKNLFSNYHLNNGSVDDGFIPSILANAVYNRSVFSRVAETNKKMFASTPADMYLAAAIFFVIDSYFCLDEPLHVWSQWSDNVTASPHRKGNGLREHYERLMNGEKPRNTPLKYAFRLNLDANAILQAKHDFGIDSVATEVDWESYYMGQYFDLARLREIGIDVSQEMRELKTALAQEPKDLRNRVRLKMSVIAVKRLLRNNLPVWSVNLLKMFRGNPQRKKISDTNSPVPENFTVIGGEEGGFDNVLQAAGFLHNTLLTDLSRDKRS